MPEQHVRRRFASSSSIPFASTVNWRAAVPTRSTPIVVLAMVEQQNLRLVGVGLTAWKIWL